MGAAIGDDGNWIDALCINPFSLCAHESTPSIHRLDSSFLILLLISETNMTIANTCVLIAAVLPVLTVGLAKFTSIKKLSAGGYDNNKPREWEAKQEGWRARAAAAQNNGFEALPLFLFAVLATQHAGLDQGRTDTLAMAFIAVRLVYIAVYLADLAAVRTLVWAGGLGLTIAILLPTLSL
jgi:uncharacterized MAPEG superfamily protein